jgi:hypothetical protein
MPEPRTETAEDGKSGEAGSPPKDPKEVEPMIDYGDESQTAKKAADGNRGERRDSE